MKYLVSTKINHNPINIYNYLYNLKSNDHSEDNLKRILIQENKTKVTNYMQMHSPDNN